MHFRKALAIFLFSCAIAVADDRARRVDEVFADVERADSPGAAVAVVRGNCTTTASSANASFAGLRTWCAIG